MQVRNVTLSSVGELLKELWLPLAALATRICDFVSPRLGLFVREMTLAMHGIWCSWKATVRKWLQTEELNQLVQINQVALSQLQQEEKVYAELLIEMEKADKERDEARLKARDNPIADPKKDTISIAATSFCENLGPVISQKGYEAGKLSFLPGLLVQFPCLGKDIESFSLAKQMDKEITMMGV